MGCGLGGLTVNAEAARPRAKTLIFQGLVKPVPLIDVSPLADSNKRVR
jgi:hypothetical protein